MEPTRFGLSTAIAMIVGIVIGSGIFFKSDNILIATGGSVALGILLFALAALGIVFGSLTIAQLAGTAEGAGGVIAYFEQAYGRRAAAAFGWFQAFIYFPALIAVIAWVFGLYLCDFWGLGSTLASQCLAGLLTICLLYALNLAAATVGALLQNAAALIKLAPLVLIALIGLFYGNGDALWHAAAFAHPTTASWLTAVGPVAFSFDGWIIATAISHEIKQPKRNLPLALTIAPLLILAVYIAYFAGISALLGPQTIMSLGDGHVALAAQMVFGQIGGRLIMVFVIISVLGTLNGIILGSIRLPYALAQLGLIPGSRYFRRLDDRLVLPVRSAVLAWLLGCGWLGLHYIFQANDLLPNSDISEMFIIISYALYIALYANVILRWCKHRQDSRFLGLLSPLLAALGSLFILYCGTLTPHFALGVAAAILVMGAGFSYSRR